MHADSSAACTVVKTGHIGNSRSDTWVTLVSGPKHTACPTGLQAAGFTPAVFLAVLNAPLKTAGVKAAAREAGNLFASPFFWHASIGRGQRSAGYNCPPPASFCGCSELRPASGSS